MLNLDHNPLVGNEDKMYKLTKKETTADNMQTLKALGIGLMHAKIPSVDATSKHLEEIFID